VNAEIISVGTEILLGQIVNTNTSYLSAKLAGLGIDLYHHSTVGDNVNRLSKGLALAISRSDIVITTGGLGPTVDDITIQAAIAACSKIPQMNKKILSDIKDFFRKRGFRAIPPGAKKQATIPRGASWFKNAVGTAPGVAFEYRNKLIILLPGPPRELIPMFEKSVIPYLMKMGYRGNQILLTRTIRTVGLAESCVNAKVKKLLLLSGCLTVGIYAHLGEVHLKINAKARNKSAACKLIAPVEKNIIKLLGKYIYGKDDDTLEGVVAGKLKKRKKTICCAESATGGLLASRITDTSGSSLYFKMGIISYSNLSKEMLLHVSGKTIKRYGAVSEHVAVEMARGIAKLSGTDISVAITGIAGPTGGSLKKPIGLVYISIISENKRKTRKYCFLGNRRDVKWQASTAALDLIRNELLS